MKYATKLGAYGLAVAAAFAVALAVLVSVSSTPTAEAQTAPTDLPQAENSVTVAPGITVRIEVPNTGSVAAFATVSITGTADGVGASFVSGGGQSINCSDAETTTGCDKNATAGEISVDLKVDEDAGEGHILIRIEGVGVDEASKVITVSKDDLVGSVKLTAVSKTIAASDNTDTADIAENETTLVMNVKNAATTPAGLNDQAVTLVTTLGTISCDGTAFTQACTTALTADSASTPGVAEDGVPGYITATLRGGGVEGVATITATLKGLTDQVDVTLFGAAKELLAEPLQDSIEIGGNTYVVLTVTDGAGNPVSGQVIMPVGSKEEVVGPGDDPVSVTTSKDATDTDTSDGTGYNRDYIHATDSKKSIPACGDDKDPVTDTAATPATTEDFTSNGTNDSGKCVVFVEAPDDGTAATTATRGAHTLNFAIDSIKASAVIEVAGKPHRITTDADALDMVEPGSVSTITVSVFDDEDVLVGITSVKVRKVDGGGLIEDEGEGGSEMTKDGQSQFTFIAPSSPGSSEILITAGDVNHRVTLQIGEAMPEEPEEPAMPDEAPSLTRGLGLATFSGGSIEELASAALAHCTTAAVWVEDGSGTGQQILLLAGGALPIGQAALEAVYPNGLDAHTPVLITRCEGDGMEDEG